MSTALAWAEQNEWGGQAAADAARDADRHLAEAARVLAAATHHEVDTAVLDVLRRTEHFVRSVGIVVLLPSDDRSFDQVYAWTPFGVPSDLPPFAPGTSDWLADLLDTADGVVVVRATEIPERAARMRTVAHEFGLAALGILPIDAAPTDAAVDDRDHVAGVAHQRPGLLLVAPKRVFRFDEFGDVTRHRDEPAESRLLAQVRQDALQTAPRSIAVTHAHDRSTARAARRERGETGCQVVLIVGVYELEDVAPDELARLVAENVANRRAHVRERRLLVDRNHDIVYMELDGPTVTFREIRATFRKLGLEPKFVGAIPPELRPKTKTQPLSA